MPQPLQVRTETPQTACVLQAASLMRVIFRRSLRSLILLPLCSRRRRSARTVAVWSLLSDLYDSMVMRWQSTSITFLYFSIKGDMSFSEKALTSVGKSA